jgi:hypothetical protein
MASSIKEELRVRFDRSLHCSDSMTVVGWIRTDSHRLPTFRSNQVGEILEMTDAGECRWIPSDINVEDDAA